jgi:hypothetical protein
MMQAILALLTQSGERSALRCVCLASCGIVIDN